MIKNVLFITLFAILLVETKAQTVFVSHAKITFEKKLNIQRQLENDSWISNEAREKMQKYVSTFWTYTFNDSLSSYKAIKKETSMDNSMYMFSNGANTAEMFTHLGKKERVIRRSIMDDDYILNDTIPRVNWKIMNEVRKIAGFECRKAIGVINDSVYVVAFYTDEILFRGGPEGFTGLPGLILGLAIPQLYTTWFATKIEGVNVPLYDIQAPKKGKRTDTEKDLNKLISAYLGNQNSKDPKLTETFKKNIYGFIL